jgi:hypothetical protein
MNDKTGALTSNERAQLVERLRNWLRGGANQPDPYTLAYNHPVTEDLQEAIRLLEAPAPETPDGECRHDLLRPDTTIEVIDPWKAKCKVCINFFDLPGRPEQKRLAPLWSGDAPGSEVTPAKAGEQRVAYNSNGDAYLVDQDTCEVHPNGCPPRSHGDGSL